MVPSAGAAFMRAAHVQQVCGTDMRDMGFDGRIGFFEKFPFHGAMLRPVYEQLRERLDCLYTDDFQAMIDFRPAILLLAEHHNAFFRPHLPQTLVVSTTHGLGASKNYSAESMPWFDIVCLPSQWYREYFVGRGWLPRLDFWVTGFPALDGALSVPPPPAPAPVAAARARGEPVLLFAPTYTPGLTALEVLPEQWMQALCARHETLTIAVKLHPHTAARFPEWQALYQRLAAAQPRVVLLEDCDSNVYDLLPHADILLTDVSSVAFNFLAFDRPVVFVDNPRRQDSPRNEPDGLAWQWRDMGERVTSQEELERAVDRALASPENLSPRRQEYRRRRFGELADGGAAARIAGALLDLVEPGAQQQP